MMHNTQPCIEKKVPNVEPLHFLTNENESSLFLSLPAEILALCLVQYADWGTLAKLSCVKKSWSKLLIDAGIGSEWTLAQALLEGSHGLQVNNTLAMKLLYELAGVVLLRSENSDEEATPTFTYQIIVDNPFTPAMKRLGECYLQQNNIDEGLAWLKAAHELGNDLHAAFELGEIYEHGRFDLDPDVYLATEWYKKAAEGGHIDSMAEYGMCCELGCGRDPDDEEALEWYMKAAQEGHVTANFSVGEAFEEARGVPQSDTEACLWYYKAAIKGDDGSIAALRRLHDIARIVVPGITTLLGN